MESWAGGSERENIHEFIHESTANLHGLWHQHILVFRGKKLHAFCTVHLLYQLQSSFCHSQLRHLAVMDLSGKKREALGTAYI
jgi:hypothetical protein